MASRRLRRLRGSVTSVPLMKHPILAKVLAVLATIVLVALVLARIGHLVDERQHYQREAVQSVQQSHVGAQTLVGPLLQRPCVETWTVQVGDGRDRRNEVQRRDFTLRATPSTLALDTHSLTEARQRGLFKVNGYITRWTLAAHWADTAALQPRREQPGSSISCEPITLLLATSDVRGLREATLTVGGQTVAVRPGTGHERYPRGLQATLALEAPEAIDARLTLTLLGTAQLAVVPASESIRWSLRSDWPHPSFGGRFLPTQREVGDAGFNASWSLSSLASSAANDVRHGFPHCEVAAGQPCLDTLSVAFVDPINPYMLADRAIKYGLLFVALTFIGVALAEALARQQVRRVHPVQYALVGLALALFFLLLLSLSEHIEFWMAYAAAAAGCVGLLALYGRHMLGSVRNGACFGAAMALLYGLLYLLLLREQTALVLGSLGLFAALATVMLVTRRIDWYELSRGSNPAPATPAP